MYCRPSSPETALAQVVPIRPGRVPTPPGQTPTPAENDPTSSDRAPIPSEQESTSADREPPAWSSVPQDSADVVEAVQPLSSTSLTEELPSSRMQPLQPAPAEQTHLPATTVAPLYAAVPMVQATPSQLTVVARQTTQLHPGSAMQPSVPVSQSAVPDMSLAGPLEQSSEIKPAFQRTAEHRAGLLPSSSSPPESIPSLVAPEGSPTAKASQSIPSLSDPPSSPGSLLGPNSQPLQSTPSVAVPSGVVLSQPMPPQPAPSLSESSQPFPFQRVPSQPESSLFEPSLFELSQPDASQSELSQPVCFQPEPSQSVSSPVVPLLAEQVDPLYASGERTAHGPGRR